MSYIDSISQASTASTASTSTSDNAAVLGKQDFLTLLVAQLQNQDPLNPDDPTEFTAQLAQFSSLEQLFNLNDTMTSVADTIQQSDSLSALQTIGKDVAYNGSSFTFDGTSEVVGYQLEGSASEVQLLIQQNGETVATLDATDLSEGIHYITWDGTTDSGETAAAGSYKLVIQAKAAEGESVAASPVVRSEVTGVDLSDSAGGTLITDTGSISFTSILGIYDKNSSSTSSSSSSSTSDDEEDDDSIIDDATDAVADTSDLVDETESLVDSLTD